MKQKRPFILSILTGLLLIAAWPVSPFTPLIFLAWVPLLLLADSETGRMRFLKFSYLAMLIWNIGTTWWIWNSTAAGAIGAILANAFLMCIPLWGFHTFKQKFGNITGLVSFFIFWLGFEYIHLSWQLSWPWLTLGNVFATTPGWVQWYEYTGVSGGSLWVLLINVLIFSLIKSWRSGIAKTKFKIGIAALLVILIPLCLSWLISNKLSAQNAGEIMPNVVIVQPNVNPYEKFETASAEGQIQNLIALSEKSIDDKTKLVLWPETALPVAAWQDQVQQNMYYSSVFEFVNRHPNLTLQTGIETYKNYGTSKETNTARKNEGSGTYYDAFNAAVFITANQPLQFYNKSKLVPGVETLPDFLIWMGAIFEQFGGTAGGYGKDKEAHIFKQAGNPFVTAPIICYESIYGDYVTNYVHKGANLLTIMTNDGWWANTAGHRQHLHYARLRAIETRKWIARSANTGISAVIDNKGNLLETKPWEETAVIKYAIPPIEGETFYVRNGSMIYVMAVLLMGALLLYNFVMLVRKKFLPRKL